MTEGQENTSLSNLLDSRRQKSSRWWRALSRTRVVLLSTAASILAYIGVTWGSAWVGLTDSDRILKTLTVLAAGTTFGLSYLQWRLARKEASFDKYYDRLNTVNDAINAAGLKEANDKDGELSHLRNMVVFAQLDNFEYVYGKYQLNFIDSELVDRAVRSLRSDCDQPWFREKVLHWVGRDEGQQVAKGYYAVTREVARLIVSQAQQPPRT